MNPEKFIPESLAEQQPDLKEMVKGKPGRGLALALVAALAAGPNTSEAQTDSFIAEVGQDTITAAFESGSKEKVDALLDNASPEVKAEIEELRGQVFNNIPEQFAEQEPVAFMSSESVVVDGQQESTVTMQNSPLPSEFTGEVAHFSSTAAFQHNTEHTVWSGHESQTFFNPVESAADIEVVLGPIQTISAEGMSMEEAIQSAVIESVRAAGVTIERDQVTDTASSTLTEVYQDISVTESIAHVSYKVVEQDVSEEGVVQVNVEVQIGAVETE